MPQYNRVKYYSMGKPYWDIEIIPSPLPSPSMTPTPSATPSITPSITLTPSITPTITPTISITPSITNTTTPSATPSITPSINSLPPSNLYISGLTTGGGENWNGCFTYNEVSYMDIAANPTYRSGANSRDSLNYASYTYDNDPTQKIIIITDRTSPPLPSSVTGFTLFDIQDVSISGFTDSQSMGTGWLAIDAIPNMTQAPNGVYHPEAGTYSNYWGTWTLSYTCPP